ncbi:hypothetical protein AXF42_Ash020463 [Apostasia shenzhenica]|uniref:Uncharacterized protein n=1 Tax=Apostasia shenzhenica TaxID=1088818 RepID=A0A2H9ZYI7_9ASPA|nr:hypothetical protein AXF42_Ash020463 [Apostasia shenzhenica]
MTGDGQQTRSAALACTATAVSLLVWSSGKKVVSQMPRKFSKEFLRLVGIQPCKERWRL